MSFDQPRQPAGAPTGGQFAATAHRESGLALVPDSGPDPVEVLTARLAAAEEYLEYLHEVNDVLKEQHDAAVAASRAAATAREARDAGADLAELEFLFKTVWMQVELADFDVRTLAGRVEIVRDGAKGVVAAAKAREGGYTASGRPGAEPYLAALDAECDAGRLGTHPWRHARRDALIADLTQSLEQAPRHPAASAWREQLAVLADPRRLNRITVETRTGGASAADLERTKAAMRAVDDYLDGAQAPHLQVV